jgi:hypothetical protein
LADPDRYVDMLIVRVATRITDPTPLTPAPSDTAVTDDIFEIRVSVDDEYLGEFVGVEVRRVMRKVEGTDDTLAVGVMVAGGSCMSLVANGAIRESRSVRIGFIDLVA